MSAALHKQTCRGDEPTGSFIGHEPPREEARGVRMEFCWVLSPLYPPNDEKHTIKSATEVSERQLPARPSLFFSASLRQLEHVIVSNGSRVIKCSNSLNRNYPL